MSKIICEVRADCTSCPLTRVFSARSLTSTSSSVTAWGPIVAVGVIVGRMGRADDLKQPLVLHDPLGALARGAVVVGGRRLAQGPADRLDPEALATPLDERAHFVQS
ncbi:MAG: hypothetical protein V7607_2095 [Solirubrobacteraceae bacterium]